MTVLFVRSAGKCRDSEFYPSFVGEDRLFFPTSWQDALTVAIRTTVFARETMP